MQKLKKGKGITIRFRLLRAFLGFSLLVLSLLGAFWIYDNETSRLQKIVDTLQNVENQLLKAGQAERDFLIFDTRNPAFFQNQNSEYLRQHHQLLHAVKKSLKALAPHPLLARSPTDSLYKQLMNQLQAYEQQFDFLVSLIRLRGFKNFGLEGKMRKLIHEVEEALTPLNLEKVLMIRRHEKDFILRKEVSYILKMRASVNDLQNYIRQQTPPGPSQKDQLRKLQLYHQIFEQLVGLEAQIGFEPNSGRQGRLAALSQKVQNNLPLLRQSIAEKAASQRQYRRWGMLSLLAGAFVLVSLAGARIARQVGVPIRQLSEAIYQIIDHQFQAGIQIPHTQQRDEVGHLARDFALMYKQLLTHNEEIKQQSEEIATQRDLLAEQNITILKAQNQIQQINTALTDLNQALEQRVAERTQALQETNEELDLFLYRASHDLKGPIARLEGLLHLAQLEKDPLFVPVLLPQFARNVRQLNRLLDKFLMIFEINREDRTWEMISLPSLWQEALMALARWQDFDEARFELFWKWQSPFVFHSDRSLLVIILVNLLENALVFGQKKKVEVYLTYHNHCLCLQVKDYGEGIAAQFLPEQVFQLFFRGSETSTGNGLGLYVVKKALEKLGGNIQIQLLPEPATLFEVKVPGYVPPLPAAPATPDGRVQFQNGRP
ncbi:MAG: hypothetical protein OHK0053_19690 [Microscillaceae bacterium]